MGTFRTQFKILYLMLACIAIASCGGSAVKVPVTLEFPQSFVAQNDIDEIRVVITASDIVVADVTRFFQGEFDDPPVLDVDVLPGEDRLIEVKVFLQDNTTTGTYSSWGFYGSTTTDIPETGATVAMDMDFMNFAYDAIGDGAINIGPPPPVSARPDIATVGARWVPGTPTSHIIIGMTFAGTYSPTVNAPLQVYIEGDDDRDETTGADPTKMLKLVSGTTLFGEVGFRKGSSKYIFISCDDTATSGCSSGSTNLKCPEYGLYNPDDDTIILSDDTQLCAEYNPDTHSLLVYISESFFTEIDNDVTGSFNVLAGFLYSGTFYVNDIAYTPGTILYDFDFGPSGI